MTVWANCTMEIIYEDNRPLASMPCEVRISNGTIAVSYEEIDGAVVYEGPEVEPGHFKLAAQKVSGRGTLHRFHDDDLLEGGWSEDGLSGMWRITLEN